MDNDPEFGIGTDDPLFKETKTRGRINRPDLTYPAKKKLQDAAFTDHFKALKKMKVPDREALPEANAPLDAEF